MPMTNAEVIDADDQADLLVDRRRADDVAGLEVLRGVAGVGGGDADDGADRQRHRRVDVAGPAERHEDQAGDDQRRDRHARDRVRRRADEAGDARRHGGEEEAEDDDEDRRRGRCPGSAGRASTARKMASSSDPPSTTIIGMSRSVRSCVAAAPPAPKPFRPSRADETIVGSVRASVMRPAASTAPAPM